MKYEFVEKKFRERSLNIIKIANGIIDEYNEEGYSLTLRQLYYQFVARGYIENSQKSYNNLGSIINDGRLAGYIDWLAIEDRTRFLRGLNTYENPREFLNKKIEDYHIDKWAYQVNRPEVWIEKDALVGIIEPICNELEIDYYSCRGYVSQSEIYRHGYRMKKTMEAGQRPVVIHLGDHDPSGIDMTRDICDRLELMAGNPIKVMRIALTMRQVEEIKPPPNPAKITDSRSKEYIKNYGKSSWELDALDPKYIHNLIRENALCFHDEDVWAVSEKRERKDLRKLRKIIKEGI